MSWLLYLRKSALHLAKNSIPGFLAWFAGQKPITQTRTKLDSSKPNFYDIHSDKFHYMTSLGEVMISQYDR